MLRIPSTKKIFIIQLCLIFTTVSILNYLWVNYITPYEIPFNFSNQYIGFLFILSLSIASLNHYINAIHNHTPTTPQILTEALNTHTRFWCIIKHNNNIVHTSPIFKLQFPRAQKIADLFKHITTENDKERLISALSNHTDTTVQFSHDTSSSSQKLYLMHMQNPTGYSFLYIPLNDSIVDHTYVLDTTITAHYTLSENGDIIYMNNACLELLGYQTIQDIANPRNFYELLSSNLPQPTKETFQGSDHWKGKLILNTKKHQDLNIYTEQYTNHESNQKHGIITPVTTMQTTALSSDITKSAWSIYLQNAPTASVSIDKNGTIIRRNNSFDQLVNLPSNDNNITIFDIISPEEKEKLNNHFKNINQTSPTTKTISITFKPRNEKSAELYICSLPKSKKASKHSPAFICHLIDTTEQKSLEARFAHSQRMQAIGQLAGGIAHDFNNLLTAIIGFCDLLLLRHPAGDRSFSDIMQIKQNSTRAANLVRQLLAFSRKQTLQPEVISITDILSEISHLIRRLIGENIELEMNHGRNIGKTKVDQGQFEQVIINLAVNARDAINERGTLSIQTENVTITQYTELDKNMLAPGGADRIKPGEYIKLAVTDTGCGIPKSKIDQIFEPFFTTKELGSGTGLGLSTVYGIINQTEGYIFVNSQHNKGTTFTIFLKTHAGTEETHKKIEEDTSDTIDLTGKETILLVEDEDPVRAFSTQALSNKGYKVLDADSGITALEIAKEHINDIDLIITDVMMPGMNGPTMIKEIQKINPHINVIFISGYAEDAFISSYGSDRNFHFLPKPFTLKQLAIKVKETLREQK